MKLKVFISCDLKNQLQMRVLMNISNLMRVVGSGRSCYVTGNDISILMFASLIANILALATIIFSMQVYDRVVPSQSIPTLWVLAGGVLIAAIFDFVLRVARIYFIRYYW